MLLSEKRAHSVHDWLVESLGLGVDRRQRARLWGDQAAGAGWGPGRAGDQPPGRDRDPADRLAARADPRHGSTLSDHRLAAARCASGQSKNSSLAVMKRFGRSNWSSLSGSSALLRSDPSANPPKNPQSDERLSSLSRNSLVLAASLIVGSSSVKAAEITWAPPERITASTDILNPEGGVLHVAADFNTDDGTSLGDDNMINGIEFTQTPAAGAEKLDSTMNSGLGQEHRPVLHRVHR